MRKLNNKGSALIMAYFVLFILVSLSASILLLNTSEMDFSRRYVQSVSAFWLAEAGIHMYLKDPALLQGVKSKTLEEGHGRIILARDDSDPTKLTITSTGRYRGVSRTIEITYPPQAPAAFENALSTKGDVLITGRKASLIINDKARLAGKFVDKGKHSQAIFEDRREGEHPLLVSLTYPDANRNGKPDEFDDFVQFNRELLAGYPPQDVLYLQGQDNYIITPGSRLDGKRIVFVEGSQGRGNVTIFSSGVVDRSQKLTVISTGTVTFSPVGDAPADSQLNIIAWSGYRETAALPGSHRGIIYTHGTAHFDQIFDSVVTNGSVLANEGITFGEIWSTKIFNYVDPRENEMVPAGFEGLIGGGSSGYLPRPSSWKETST